MVSKSTRTYLAVCNLFLNLLRLQGINTLPLTVLRKDQNVTAST